MGLFSLIIPVYNRPDEVDELLDSLVRQSDNYFEVIIVEDGSTKDCKEVMRKYIDKLTLSYYLIPNSGPGQARNYGAAYAKGDYLIVLDSDCIAPENYIKSVREELSKNPVDAFGGPDKALDTFTPLQKAINYSMTSLFTTGGIRGRKNKIGKFYPRSFNMGIRRNVYENLGGFAKMRFGEDIDFSIRIYKANYNVSLFSSAFVYHKRRNNFKSFFKQVYNSGIARVNLFKKYPDSLKLIHFFPSAFTLYSILALAAFPWCTWGVILLFYYLLIILIDSSLQNKSIKIGFLSVSASIIQLTGYGLGFLVAVWRRIILRKSEFSSFEENFYK